MRFLILTQYFPPEVGGAQTRLAALARQLKARGQEVEIVTAMPHHLLGRTFDGYRRRLYLREMFEGIPVHRTWVYAATGTGVRRIINYLSFSVSGFLGVMRARKPDIIFVESPPLTLGLTGWMGAAIRRAKLIFNVSDLWPDSVRDLGVIRGGPILRVAEWLETWTYRRAAIVNAVTENIAEVLRTTKAVPQSKVKFLPNGVDLAMFQPRPPKNSLVEELGVRGLPVLLYAGTHGIGMGLENVLGAAFLLKNEAFVVFVGAGPTKPMLLEGYRRSGGGNVRFVDPVPLSEMPAYFSIAYASVVPLVRSGVTRGARPSKIFPSLASGVPVIYSGEGEGANLVVKAGAGIAVPPEDAVAIADAMRKLINDRNLRARMADNARRLAVDRFDWSGIVGQWLDSLGDDGTQRASLLRTPTEAHS